MQNMLHFLPPPYNTNIFTHTPLYTTTLMTTLEQQKIFHSKFYRIILLPKKEKYINNIKLYIKFIIL